MKKYLSILLAVVLAFALAGCASMLKKLLLSPLLRTSTPRAKA